METILFKVALFLSAAVVSGSLIKRGFVDLCLFFYYIGLVVLPVLFVAEQIGYALVPGYLFGAFCVFWCGHMTGVVLTVWWCIEYLGLRNRFRK
jgi:hypothetical protein